MKILENAIYKLLANVSNMTNIMPSFITEPPGIAYTITPLTGGVVKQSQLEVRVISNDIDNALETNALIEDALDMTQNKKSLEIDGIILRSQQAGGASPNFQDGPQVWEISRYYIITWRCKD